MGGQGSKPSHNVVAKAVAKPLTSASANDDDDDVSTRASSAEFDTQGAQQAHLPLHFDARDKWPAIRQFIERPVHQVGGTCWLEASRTVLSCGETINQIKRGLSPEVARQTAESKEDALWNRTCLLVAAQKKQDDGGRPELPFSVFAGEAVQHKDKSAIAKTVFENGPAYVWFKTRRDMLLGNDAAFSGQTPMMAVAQSVTGDASHVITSWDPHGFNTGNRVAYFDSSPQKLMIAGKKVKDGKEFYLRAHASDPKKFTLYITKEQALRGGGEGLQCGMTSGQGSTFAISGSHAVVVYGWRCEPSGGMSWLVKNSWGSMHHEVALAAVWIRPCCCWLQTKETLEGAVQSNFVNNSWRPQPSSGSALQLSWEGTWASKYGSHGIEFQTLYRNGSQLEAFKLTGDPNVPAGYRTWRTVLDLPGVPNTSQGKMTVRCNTRDMHGFSEEDANIKRVHEDQIEVEWGSYKMNYFRLIKDRSQLDATWSGIWEVEFDPGHKELCVVYRDNGKLTAKKILGNRRISAGQVSWVLPASAGSPSVGQEVGGQGQWAKPGGVDVHWRNCTLKFESTAKIVTGNGKIFNLKFHM